MNELLTALPLEGISSAGLVALIVLFVGRGYWVPSSTVREIKALRDERIRELAAERDDWRATAQAKDETLRLQGAQVDELLELARTGNALMRALASATGREVS